MFTLQARKASLELVAFSADGTVLAAAGMRGPILLWDLAERRLAHKITFEDDVFVHQLSFTPDDEELLALLSPASLQIGGLYRFDPHSGEQLDVVPIDATGGVFSPDGRLMCALYSKPARTREGSELELRMVRLPDCSVAWIADLPDMAAMTAMDYSGDGRLVAAGKQVGSVHLYSAASGLHLGQCGPQRSGEVRSLALSPDGRTVAWCAATQLHVWRTSPPSQVAHHHMGKTHFFSVRMHPSGDFFATANGDGKIDFWHTRTGEHRHSYDWGTGKLHAVAFDATGDRAVCCGKTGQIVVWDVAR